MDFTLSEERRMLQETARRWLRENHTIKARNAAAATEAGFDRDLWATLADMGLPGALIPAEAGGYGGTGEDIMVVMEEAGRAAVTAPLMATLAAGTALAAAGGEAQTALLEDVIAGTTLIALAHGEPEGRYDLAAVATRAEQAADGWRLTGRKAVVANGATADHLVVTARVSGQSGDEAGLALFLVAGDAGGLTRRGTAAIDGSAVAEITLDATPATPLGTPGEAFAVIEQVIAAATLGVAAEAVGLMETCKDITLDYLRTRKQFGVPLGRFQALQHRMVDAVLEIEQARSAVMLAAGSLDADRATRERAVSAAKSLTGRVGRQVAEEAIQMHGGIAMTWEYDLAHYAKRLVMLDHLMGDEDHHLARFIALGKAA